MIVIDASTRSPRVTVRLERPGRLRRLVEGERLGIDGVRVAIVGDRVAMRQGVPRRARTGITRLRR
jgi:hypothetical protein